MLTRKDELMLLAILKLGEEASLVRLRELITEQTGTEWSIGNVFVTLDKLEAMEYIQATLGEPTAKRGGKAVKFYHVTREGLTALRQTKQVQDGMWAGLVDLVFNE
ncbi:helix-turn-helix transcriptional regulator [candidate division KSB1 bacterium]|nr:helix-turn-helix transcriptional regulator [candidate division KSB1 bacterium]